MTARTLIKAALRAIGVIASGETPSASEMADGLEALQIMLRGWGAERIMVYTTTNEHFTLTANDGDYTIGSGGDFNTTRPTRISGAFVRGSGVDVPLKIIGEAEYRAIGTKDAGGTPGQLYYNPAYPLGLIYLYPVPSSALVLYLDNLRPLTEPTTLTDSISFPLEYDEAIKFNLAVRMAPEFGVSVPPEVAAIAMTAKDKIQALNAALQLEPVRLDILDATRKYHINHG